MILALETTTNHGSVAVLSNGRILAQRAWQPPGKHSETLTSAVEDCLHECARKISELTAVAVDHGPGSFTGIRVGISAAKTLGYALNIPVRCYTSVEILAFAAQQKNLNNLPLVIILNAHRDLVYFAEIPPAGASHSESMSALTPATKETSIETLPLEAVSARIQKTCLAVGDGVVILQQYQSLMPLLSRNSEIADFPTASALGFLDKAQENHRESLVWNAVQPLYIRDSNAEEKSREG